MKSDKVSPSVLSMQPIDHQSVQEKVYERITEVLMRGGFQPGQKVSSRKLAAALGTSDMPVRAALGRLVAEGAVTQNANGTFTIPLISRKKFQDVMELRALLEGRATTAACGRMSQKSLHELKTFGMGLEEAIAKNDIDLYLDYNQRLKFSIYKHCNSDILFLHIRLLWLLAAPFLRHLNKDLSQMTDANFHDAAIAALIDNRAEDAGAEITRDVQAGMAFLLKHGKFAEDV
ncbi:GntR family transcriptional regulator [Rhizobium oryziradicis]|uniref:HTH gntR-type domain-containing protein n=1 Tax=Rhizobium oryziradicis TaxID=1867956 RepID=A0A1Q8ZWC0_9HYPH|nr:GntR family transcriptional regulator [Rhizobium oryziradicis]OLP46374.1 hypothetical protein BJF95_04175 [Rhizobium oryziradicis]